MNIAEFSGTPLSQNTSGQLLLHSAYFPSYRTTFIVRKAFLNVLGGTLQLEKEPLIKKFADHFSVDELSLKLSKFAITEISNSSNGEAFY